jgi:predicted nucleotidyltransferase
MDILRLFNSKTRRLLFQLFFTNPDSEYYLRELERILEIPVAMVRRELLRLEDEGVFLSIRKGNLVYFRLNQSYPLFDELKSIVFKTVGVEGILKEAIGKIKGVTAALIYGSFAKNRQTAVSDIDLLIIGRIDEDCLVRELNKVENILKREINYTLFSPVEYKKKKSAKDPFISDLLEKSRILIAGDEDDL